MKQHLHEAEADCFYFLSATSSASSTPVRGGSTKLQDSSDFFDQLNSADSFKRKPRVAHNPKPSTSGIFYFIITDPLT